MFRSRSRLFATGMSIVALAATLLLGACIQGEAVAKPPDIRFGQDTCADCGMIISDPRFAAAYAWEIEPGRYQSLAFDDIGDMVHHIKNNQDKKITDYWVHDYKSQQWIDAQIAYYLISPKIQTPMMHGVAAFAAEADAKAMAGEVQSEVFDWDHMRAQVLLHNH